MAENAAALERVSPKQVRARLRRGSVDPDTARELLGGKPLDQWDVEELARGRPKGPDGKFPGGPKPAWITGSIEKQVETRYRRWIEAELKSAGIGAMRVVRQILQDESESGKTRLEAAKFIFDHVIGKPTQEVRHDASTNLQDLLAGMLVNPDGELAQEIIDVEPIEDDDEDFYDDD